LMQCVFAIILMFMPLNVELLRLPLRKYG